MSMLPIIWSREKAPNCLREWEDTSDSEECLPLDYSVMQRFQSITKVPIVKWASLLHEVKVERKPVVVQTCKIHNLPKYILKNNTVKTAQQTFMKKSCSIGSQDVPLKLRSRGINVFYQMFVNHCEKLMREDSDNGSWDSCKKKATFNNWFKN